MIITIDGPTASGKSTVAKKLAQKLNFKCINTGNIYRAVAYVLLNNYRYTLAQLQSPDITLISAIVNAQHLQYDVNPDSCGTVIFDSIDITDHLKSEEVSQAASIISIVAYVRTAINARVHELANAYDVVAEGRDMGSIVFPTAEYKFFVTASNEVRAQRWQGIQQKFGNIISFDEAMQQITERDTRDMNRSIAPLVIAQGAIVIDTSYKTIEQTIDSVIKYVKG